MLETPRNRECIEMREIKEEWIRDGGEGREGEKRETFSCSQTRPTCASLRPRNQPAETVKKEERREATESGGEKDGCM